MHSGRYYFGLICLLGFITTLIIFTTPIKVGNSIVSSYFAILPDETDHYTQVLDGTNTSANIVIDNTNGYALNNLYFMVNVSADKTLLTDVNIAGRFWNNNFSVLSGEIKTIKFYFNATNEESSKLYISISWGEISYDQQYARLSELKIGSEFVKTSFFTFQNIMILTMSIAIGITLLIFLISARMAFKRYRKRRSPQPSTAPPPAPPSTTPMRPPTQPSHHGVLIPPSTIAPPTTPTEPLPTVSIELIPCPKCGSKIDKSQIICPNCGYELPKCTICNLVVDDDDAIETCPECGAIGHRTHFREWVHIKGKCPICKKNITF